jgi:hypothetical protein
VSWGSRTPTAISRCTAMLSSRTTTTGLGARLATYLLTEPSAIATKPHAPRAPTTSMDASAPFSATASAGGPDSSPVVSGRPGATSWERVMAASRARAAIPRSAQAISSGEVLGPCTRGTSAGADTIRSGAECRLASRAAHSTARSDSSEPSTLTTTGLAAMTGLPEEGLVSSLGPVPASATGLRGPGTMVPAPR